MISEHVNNFPNPGSQSISYPWKHPPGHTNTPSSSLGMRPQQAPYRLDAHFQPWLRRPFPCYEPQWLCWEKIMLPEASQLGTPEAETSSKSVLLWQRQTSMNGSGTAFANEWVLLGGYNFHHRELQFLWLRRINVFSWYGQRKTLLAVGMSALVHHLLNCQLLSKPNPKK